MQIKDFITGTAAVDGDYVPLSQSGNTRKVTVEQIRGVVNDLTTGGIAVPLSAEQGKTLNTSLSDIVNNNAINPEYYKAPVYDTDYKKLQKAFDDAFVQERPLNISKTYNIGANTIVFNKGTVIRSKTYVFGGGKIIKDTAGYMFSAVSYAQDIVFNDIRLEGVEGVQVSAFDCSNNNIVNFHTNNCYFKYLYNVFYSNQWIETFTMNGDLISNCTNAVFDIQGAYAIKVNNIVMSGTKSSFVKHGGTGAHPYLINCVFRDSAVQGISTSAPVFSLKNCIDVVIDGFYLEDNVGGHIVFASNATCYNVQILNCTHTGIVDTTALIKWGFSLNGCIATNNYSSSIPIHDTTNIFVGNVISTNDYSTTGILSIGSMTQNIFITQNNLLDITVPSNVKFTNLLTSWTQSSALPWVASGGATLGLPTDSPYISTNYLRIVGSTSVNNSYARCNLTTKTNKDEYYAIYFMSKADNLSPFTFGIFETTTAANLGSYTFYPTKINQWGVFCAVIKINADSTQQNYIALYPKQASNSANAVRDFDTISLYKVNSLYDINTIKNSIGYTVGTCGAGLNKLDANGDGVADIPYNTTALRPILTASQIAFHFFDTTLEKPIWWNGTVWKDATGTTV